MKLCYLALYIYCTPLATYTTTWLLERNYLNTFARPNELDGIVVLGGGLRPPSTDGEPYRLDEHSYRRCERAAELYLAGESCPILVSGGILPNLPDGPAVSQLMAEQLFEFGVAPDNVIQENESRTTEENARLSAPLIQDRGWRRVALVTNATHLMRSQRLFRNRGLETIPVGCQFRTQEFQWGLFAVLPRYHAVMRHEEAWHEILGCAYLMLRGK